MAKVEEPVIVSIVREDNGEYSFQVQDVGLGLDDIEFNKYIMGIGESTKQSISNVLGGFGLGSKAASSYQTDGSYFYVCRKNGIERKFMIFAGEEMPQSMMIYEKPTEERNGVTVIVPIKNGDRREFEEKIKEQLCYFSGVYFVNCGINNDFKIIEHDLWKFSALNSDTDMHLCLDDVYYPLDYNKLGIDRIRMPLGIKFKLEEGLITPIPNRENIEYTRATKEVILARINQISDYFVDKFNEHNLEVNTAKEVRDFVKSWKRNVEISEHEFEINDIYYHRTKGKELVMPKLKGTQYLSSQQISDLYPDLLDEYIGTTMITGGRFTQKEAHKKDVLNELHKSNFTKIVVVDTELKGQHKEYLKDQYNNVLFVRKYRSRKLGKYSLDARQLRTAAYRESYVSILELYNQPKQNWRAIIQEYQNIVKHYEAQLLPLSSVVISEEWKLGKKKQRELRTQLRQSLGRGVRLQGQINFKFAQRLEKYSQDFSCKFVSELLDLKDFHKNKFLTVYGREDQRQLLDQLYVINKGSIKQIKIAMLAQRDYDKLSTTSLHNLMSIEKFTSEKNKVIARYVTSYKVDQVLRKYATLRDNSEFIAKHINSDLGKLIDELITYKRKYETPDNDLMKTLVRFCDANKYYDYDVYPLIQELEKQAPKLDFLYFLRNGGYRYNSQSIQSGEDVIAFIQETLRHRKFRMDWKHYVKSEQSEIPQPQ